MAAARTTTAEQATLGDHEHGPSGRGLEQRATHQLRGGLGDEEGTVYGTEDSA